MPAAKRCMHQPFPPTLARDGASVSFGFNRTPLPHIRDTVSISSGDGPTGIRTQGILLAKEALYR